MVAVTSISGEWLALFWAAGRWQQRQNALGLNSPGASQAGQTGLAYLGKKCCLVLACSLATQVQVWFCWGLILCGLLFLLKNNSALPLIPDQHGNMVEIMLWADAATPPIWSTIFRQDIGKEQDPFALFLMPSFPNNICMRSFAKAVTAQMYCIVLYMWCLYLESQSWLRTWFLVLFPPASSVLPEMLLLWIFPTYSLGIF